MLSRNGCSRYHYGNVLKRLKKPLRFDLWQSLGVDTCIQQIEFVSPLSSFY